MLINSLLIVLRHGLPISFLIAFFILLAPNKQKSTLLLKWTVLGLVLTLLKLSLFSELSLLFNGTGVELFHSVLNVISYLIIALLFHQAYLKASFLSNHLSNLWLILFISVVVLNLGDISLFISGLPRTTFLSKSLILGLIMAIGLCLSASILFYFAMASLHKVNPNTSLFFFLMYGVSKLMISVNLLIQINIIPSATPLWNSNTLINEQSELGYLFTTLLGYESTPNVIHITVLFTALILPYLWTKYKTKSMSSLNQAGAH